MEDDIIINNEVTNANTNTIDLYKIINEQLNFLNDKFKIYESFKNDSSDDSKDSNVSNDEEVNFNINQENVIENVNLNITNNNNNLKNYTKKNKKIQSLKSKLKEKEELLSKIQGEFLQSENEFNKKINEKDLIIDNTKRELELLKSERNESINQMQHIFKEYGVEGSKSKFSMFSMRKGGIHSQQNSVTSISSISTYHDDKILEKLNSEKIILEKQLIEYKYNYAETSSKLNDLEGEFDKLRNKCQAFVDKIKLKDILLKKISEERDHYKFNTNAHYSFNSCDYLPPDVNLKKVETVHTSKNTELADLNIDDNYINQNKDKQNIENVSLEIKNCLVTPIKQKSQHAKNYSISISTTESISGTSLISYFKNIFKSGNK